MKILTSEDAEITLLKNGNETPFCHTEKTDIREKAPTLLGSLSNKTIRPEKGEKMYETAMFSITNDCLEKRSILRSGETKIPQVKAARDAFFNQKHYKLRGCEAANMFDGKDDTFYDAQSMYYLDDNRRICGGCLRVDFGEVIECDSVEIEFFSGDKITREVGAQTLPMIAEYSTDLSVWNVSEQVNIKPKCDYTSTVVAFTSHILYDVPGKKIVSSYPINNSIRYLRIEKPVDRIYAVRAIKDGKQIKLNKPFANNMQAHYRYKKILVDKWQEFVIPSYKSGSSIAVAIEGTHGEECVYCTAEFDGKVTGFPKRAPDYKANQWEHMVCGSDKNNTFFIEIPEGMEGKTVKIDALFSRWIKDDVVCNVYICEKH